MRGDAVTAGAISVQLPAPRPPKPPSQDCQDVPAALGGLSDDAEAFGPLPLPHNFYALHLSSKPRFSPDYTASQDYFVRRALAATRANLVHLQPKVRVPAAGGGGGVGGWLYGAAPSCEASRRALGGGAQLHCTSQRTLWHTHLCCAPVRIHNRRMDAGADGRPHPGGGPGPVQDLLHRPVGRGAARLPRGPLRLHVSPRAPAA